MKKIFFILLSFALFSNALQSQNFAPTGTKWQYEFWAIGGSGIIEYEALNDTMLLGLTCRRVSYKKRCRPPSPPDCRNPAFSDAMLYFHERNDSLFEVYRNGYINLLFSFKANVGDSLAIVDDIMGSGNSKFATVTRKSDTIIGGRTIKFWELSKKCIGTFPIDVFKFKIFEKIYRVQDGLFIWGRCDGFIEFGAGLCSFESGNWRHEPSVCRPTSVEKQDEVAATSIFPNPSSDKLTINSPILFSKYAIYNISGERVQQAALSSNNITISPLPKGIYSIQLTDNEGFSIYRKVVKQ